MAERSLAIDDEHAAFGAVRVLCDCDVASVDEQRSAVTLTYASNVGGSLAGLDAGMPGEILLQANRRCVSEAMQLLANQTIVGIGQVQDLRFHHSLSLHQPIGLVAGRAHDRLLGEATSRRRIKELNRAENSRVVSPPGVAYRGKPDWHGSLGKDRRGSRR